MFLSHLISLIVTTKQKLEVDWTHIDFALVMIEIWIEILLLISNKIENDGTYESEIQETDKDVDKQTSVARDDELESYGSESTFSDAEVWRPPCFRECLD